MIDKLNIQIIIPHIYKKYDLLIPVNQTIGQTIYTIIKGLNILNNDIFKDNNSLNLYNALDGKIYKLNEIVIDTDIKNGSILILA